MEEVWEFSGKELPLSFLLVRRLYLIQSYFSWGDQTRKYLSILMCSLRKGLRFVLQKWTYMFPKWTTEQNLGTYLEKPMRSNLVSILYSACRNYDIKIPFLNTGLLELDKERFHLCTHLNNSFHVQLLLIFILFTRLVFFSYLQAEQTTFTSRVVICCSCLVCCSFGLFVWAIAFFFF